MLGSSVGGGAEKVFGQRLWSDGEGNISKEEKETGLRVKAQFYGEVGLTKTHVSESRGWI